MRHSIVQFITHRIPFKYGLVLSTCWFHCHKHSVNKFSALIAFNYSFLCVSLSLTSHHFVISQYIFWMRVYRNLINYFNSNNKIRFIFFYLCVLVFFFLFQKKKKKKRYKRLIKTKTKANADSKQMPNLFFFSKSIVWKIV